MDRRKSILAGLICGFLWLLAGSTAWASSGGGTTTKENGQTEIWVGTVVDYMGKIQFQVLERDTELPIEGASIELFVPYLEDDGRYVLFGVTDEHGIYELDVAYHTSPNNADENQFTTIDGNLKFQGTLFYLNGKQIAYRIYKAGWLPYPREGEVILENREVPQVVTVYLHKKSGGEDGEDTPTKPGETISPIPPNPSEGSGSGTGTIPKTGIEGVMEYWAAGLIFFLLAGGLLWHLQKDSKRQRKERKEGVE